jgi:hypothetical protein
MESLRILKMITEKIMAKENVNCRRDDIQQALFYKRQFIITELLKGLPRAYAAMLVMKTNEWLLAYSLGLGFMRRQVMKVKSYFFSF